jgi:hypothetical protein
LYDHFLFAIIFSVKPKEAYMLKIEPVKVKDLVLPEWNPRYMSTQDMEALKRSIQEFGFVEPIVVNKPTMEVLGGNQRAKAAMELGMTEVPAVFVSLPPEKAKALNVALNKISGEWDLEALHKLLSDLSDDTALLSLTGFSEDELTDILGDLRKLDDSDPFDTVVKSTPTTPETLDSADFAGTQETITPTSETFVSFAFGKLKDAAIPHGIYDRFISAYENYQSRPDATPGLAGFLDHLLTLLETPLQDNKSQKPKPEPTRRQK